MEHTLMILLGTVAVFLALITNVAFSPRLSNFLIAGAAVIAVAGGLVFYGICYASIYDNILLAILDTCFSVFRLFLGEGAPEIFADIPLMEYLHVQIVSSILSFAGIFATAGAAVSAIGADFLRNMRLFFRRKNPLAVIFCLNPKTLEFARELVEEKKQTVVFVDENPDPTCTDSATEMGCVIRSDTNAITANTAFLRSIGASRGNRRICLYALSADRFANRQYATCFLEALCRRNIQPQQTGLTIFAEEDTTENDFSAGASRYGTVLCVNEEYMAARLLLQTAPLYETLSFDETGKATEDLHVLVVGSGNVGQAVIKQLVMNGQFCGSRFRLAVFDPEFDAITGRLRYECSQLFDNYDIRVYDADARSDRMYAFLAEHWQGLKYIVVCTGNDDSNREICRQLNHFLMMHGSELPLYVCSTRGLQKVTASSTQRWEIFTSQVLCSDEIDRKAMQLNHRYCGGASARADWETCDYFSRMSSRASADFAPAFLKMAGLPADAIPQGDWVSGALLENMAITEHERWCAFHYCMGFRPMTREEFDSRCETYLAEKAKDPATRYRIGKDLRSRIHCCLIPWDALDDLSARENAVTGKNVDYKQMDRNNVLSLPELLKE